MNKEQAYKEVEQIFQNLYYYGFCNTKEDRDEFANAFTAIKQIIVDIDTDEIPE